MKKPFEFSFYREFNYLFTVRLFDNSLVIRKRTKKKKKNEVSKS